MEDSSLLSKYNADELKNPNVRMPQGLFSTPTSSRQISPMLGNEFQNSPLFASGKKEHDIMIETFSFSPYALGFGEGEGISDLYNQPFDSHSSSES